MNIMIININDKLNSYFEDVYSINPNYEISSNFSKKFIIQENNLIIQNMLTRLFHINKIIPELFEKNLRTKSNTIRSYENNYKRLKDILLKINEYFSTNSEYDLNKAELKFLYINNTHECTHSINCEQCPYELKKSGNNEKLMNLLEKLILKIPD